MKEFEEIKSALQTYHHNGHILDPGHCGRGSFKQLKDLGYISDSQVDNNQDYFFSLKSKIKGVDGKKSAWTAHTCDSSSTYWTNKYGQPYKIKILYGDRTYQISPMSIKFCYKLVQKLRARYGEDVTINPDERRMSLKDVKKIGFGCQCLSEKLYSWGTCDAKNSDDWYAELGAYIYDFD